MTVDEVVEEYERFHGTSEEEARSQILSHAPGVDEDGIAQTRIRLVAGSFGPGVTSVVLWLRLGVDIGCIQVTARLLDGESAITSRQLLPLPVTRTTSGVGVVASRSRRSGRGEVAERTQCWCWRRRGSSKKGQCFGWVSTH
ncbi:MAG TPA: hypothetical protein VMK83_03810 [Gaiellaceae bacterium]|nr:hypothetical protein [Gaiellaceae bacterium]